ncbi:MAG TPA: Calx-beta domain-containing protein [Steroidobacter sp.]|uniref:Calx-beta domain-containing protein n=1 Tax=Steroidobacter sp. TaxID=1978227 RepID=UPI002ED8269C
MKITAVLAMSLALAPASLLAIDLDASFGTGGRVVLEDAPWNATDAVLQRDGKIVVAGYFRPDLANPAGDAFVARFNVNGTLDTSFDGDGLAVLDLGGNVDYINAIAEQVDGRLVAVGSTGSSVASYSTAAIVRLNPNGSLDTSLRGPGAALLSELAAARAVAIQADGKLLVAGSGSHTFTVARLLPDGVVDATYGENGAGLANFPPGNPSYPPFYSDVLYELALQPDGKLVGAGARASSYTPLISASFAAVRLDSAGVPDSTFGTGGSVIIPEQAFNFLGSVRGMVVLPNGSLLLAGTQTWGEGPTRPDDHYSALVRLGSTGAVDPSFGTNGWVRRVNRRLNGDNATGVALDASGNILVPGSSNRDDTGTLFDMAVSRLAPNGAMDLNFGNEGRFIVDFDTASAYGTRANALLVQPDGALILVGTGRSGPNYNDPQTLLLARLCGPTVHFSSSSTAVSEAATSVTFTIRRSCGSSAGPVSVSYATNAGTASAGSDFTAANGTLTWAPNDSDDKTITIQLPGDTSDEPDEQFTVALSGASGAEPGAWSSHAVTITDDDSTPPPPPTTSGRSGGGALDYMALLGLLTIGVVATAAPRRRPTRK